MCSDVFLVRSPPVLFYLFSPVVFFFVFFCISCCANIYLNSYIRLSIFPIQLRDILLHRVINFRKIKPYAHFYIIYLWQVYWQRGAEAHTHTKHIRAEINGKQKYNGQSKSQGAGRGGRGRWKQEIKKKSTTTPTIYPSIHEK